MEGVNTMKFFEPTFSKNKANFQLNPFVSYEPTKCTKSCNSIRYVLRKLTFKSF